MEQLRDQIRALRRALHSEKKERQLLKTKLARCREERRALTDAVRMARIPLHDCAEACSSYDSQMERGPRSDGLRKDILISRLREAKEELVAELEAAREEAQSSSRKEMTRRLQEVAMEKEEYYYEAQRLKRLLEVSRAEVAAVCRGGKRTQALKAEMSKLLAERKQQAIALRKVQLELQAERAGRRALPDGITLEELIAAQQRYINQLKKRVVELESDAAERRGAAGARAAGERLRLAATATAVIDGN
eukprot:PLAT13722.4.p1 GENE.PLAT13722.4~~PLAT13722.4.p1  ORF type:complete len:264 (+),score=55.73 PLAT13722.4:48-794(+)